MGWWQIDPETGMSLRESGKRPEDVDACYTGDTPGDAVMGSAEELRELLGESAEFSPEEAARLVFDRAVPAWVDPGKVADVLRIVEAMWVEVDDCYEDDWGRKAKPPEARAAGEAAVVYLTKDEDE